MNVSVQNGDKAVHLAMRQGHMSTAALLVLATHTLEELPVEVSFLVLLEKGRKL